MMLSSLSRAFFINALQDEMKLLPLLFLHLHPFFC